MIVAIIQARTSSKRFPGKVLEPLLGLPSIVFMTHRVRQAQSLDRILVATSTDRSDDALVSELTRHQIDCYRGDLQDVLDRYYRAAISAQAQYVVRLTGDCPLIDADLIDAVVTLVRSGNSDYASLGEKPTYPNGLEVEVMTFEALALAWREAKLPSEREHVTPFIRKHTQRFRHAYISSLGDLSALRWTVDYPDDLDYVRSIVSAVGARKPTDFDRFDLYRVIERSEALRAPRPHQRNEGYFESLRNDPDHL